MGFDLKKVLKQGDKKIVIIPKNSSVKVGDYVKISQIENINKLKEKKLAVKSLIGGFVDE